MIRHKTKVQLPAFGSLNGAGLHNIHHLAKADCSWILFGAP